MPRQFNPNVEGWEWQPDKCPCDLQFMEWLDSVSPPKSVFHMGTGKHHNVGLTCDDKGVACLGITVSTEEYLLAPISKHYQVMLLDIYDANLNLLPYFDVMTLFHLGEMVEKFGPIHEPATKNLISKVDKNGVVLFYTGSSAWDRASKVVVGWVKENFLKPSGQYKDLAIYRV